LVGMNRIEGELDRAEFEARVHAWYSQRPSYAWFVKSLGGLATNRALVEGMLNAMRDDLRADPDQVAEVSSTLVGHWEAFARTLESEDALIESVKRQFRKADQRYPHWRVYSDLNTFRTSMPSDWVHDEAEETRRGNATAAEYRVDIATLLRRAEGLRFKPNWQNRHLSQWRDGMLWVKGYGRYRKVVVSPTCEFLCNGCLSTTEAGEAANLTFRQDGNQHGTPVSHVMSMQPHVIVLLPRDMRDSLDWRIPTFTCGNRLIAFDGAALLALEIWKRRVETGGA
jgi:hypothetical protein